MSVCGLYPSWLRCLAGAATFLGCLSAPLLRGTDPETPELKPPQKPVAPAESPLIRRARVLWEENRLPTSDTLEKWLVSPSGESVQMPPASTKPLPTREVARRATAAYLRVGWVYQCAKCSNWHTNLAGGYAIAPNAVATARHVLSRPERMKEEVGYLVAVRGEQEVLVIRGVQGSDTAGDAAVLLLEATNLEPLPIQTEVQIGDPVFCLSEPAGERPYFSAGIVNRFARDPQAKENSPRVRRINVSTDWAPGSSGAAVLDAHGNAVAHVGSISALAGDRKGAEKPSHYMNLHWAIPALNVLRLADPQRSARVSPP